MNHSIRQIGRSNTRKFRELLAWERFFRGLESATAAVADGPGNVSQEDASLQPGPADSRLEEPDIGLMIPSGAVGGCRDLACTIAATELCQNATITSNRPTTRP